jgi:hypothetical protein
MQAHELRYTEPGPMSKKNPLLPKEFIPNRLMVLGRETMHAVCTCGRVTEAGASFREHQRAKPGEHQIDYWCMVESKD